MPEVRLFLLEGARRRDELVELWLSAPVPETRTVAKRWFNEWRSCGKDIDELLHDGHPTVCLHGIALGYVNAFTEHVNVGFFLGAILPDPAGLLQGKGKFMRHVKVHPADPGNEDQLRALIRAAYVDLKTRLSELPAAE